MKTRNILIAIAILLSVLSLLLSFGSVFYAGDHIKDTDTIEDTKPDPEDQTDVPGDSIPEATEPEVTEPEGYNVSLSFDLTGYYDPNISTVGFDSNADLGSYGVGSLSLENVTKLYLWAGDLGEYSDLYPFISRYEVTSGSANVKEISSDVYEVDGSSYMKRIELEITGDCSIFVYYEG